MEEGRVVEVPNVVWCTGYRSTFDWVHVDVFDQEGQPVHDRGATGVPGLYFIGLFFLSSLASSLVGGVGRDAEYIARHITRSTTRRPLLGRTQTAAASVRRISSTST
jgi:putative flavoprotein involved in K+ transport